MHLLRGGNDRRHQADDLDRAPLARWRQLQRAGLLPEHARRSASAGGKAESRQPQYHDRTRDQAPTTGDGKADGERESVLDLFC
jgi:hypothetical protein